MGLLSQPHPLSCCRYVSLVRDSPLGSIDLNSWKAGKTKNGTQDGRAKHDREIVEVSKKRTGCRHFLAGAFRYCDGSSPADYDADRSWGRPAWCVVLCLCGS